MPTKHRIFTMPFANVYPFYIAKAEKKGRTKAEVDTVICWLTGYSSAQLAKQLKQKTDFETFFAEAPKPKSCEESDHRHHLRCAGGGHLGAHDAGNTLPGQVGRRTGQGKGDGEDSAELTVGRLHKEAKQRSSPAFSHRRQRRERRF